MKCSNALGSVVVFLTAQMALGQSPSYVIHISVDGGGSNWIQNQLPYLPNFNKFVTEGATTFNARTDYNYTITLPNHTSMITGLGVSDVGAVKGHNWTTNTDPFTSPYVQTLHTNRGSYVPSIFDVAHDNGLSTAMYTGKTKFSLYQSSYNSTNGAADITGPVDNGRNKIDTFMVNTATNYSTTLTDSFITTMKATPINYTFLHYADTDEAGHFSSGGWGGTQYNAALKTIDTQLGKIFDMIANTPALTGKTMVVLTADHGGSGNNHIDQTVARDYTIPFLVWGAGVDSGADLYALNSSSRLDPGTDRPTYTVTGQPIRNGDSANFELDMLGLGPVPGSTINYNQNLVASAVPEPGCVGLVAAGGLALVWRRRRKDRKSRVDNIGSVSV